MEVTTKHLEYLDELRKSAIVNMVRASPYIQNAFCVDRKEARKILKHWMDTFGERQDKGEVK